MWPAYLRYFAETLSHLGVFKMAVAEALVAEGSHLLLSLCAHFIFWVVKLTIKHNSSGRSCGCCQGLPTSQCDLWMTNLHRCAFPSSWRTLRVLFCVGFFLFKTYLIVRFPRSIFHVPRRISEPWQVLTTEWVCQVLNKGFCWSQLISQWSGPQGPGFLPSHLASYCLAPWACGLVSLAPTIFRV